MPGGASFLDRLGRAFDSAGWKIWLAYLPLLFTPWMFNAPSASELAWTAAGVAAFLTVYLHAEGAAGGRLIAHAVAVLAISLAMAFVPVSWTVLAVYAAAMAGTLIPAGRAVALVLGFVGIVAVWGLVLGQPWTWWLVGCLLMLMAGFSNISRTAIEARNRMLEATRAEVHRLAAAAERERIGRDLHDLLGRNLTLIAIKADLAARLAARAETAEHKDRAISEINEIAQTARTALAEVRAAVAGMGGTSLDREVAAARSALADAGIACTVEGDVEGIEPGAGAVLAMTLREAVTNVIRHAGARTCHIAIGTEAAGAALLVRDDGVGATAPEGSGLTGLRARLAAAGGALTVESGPGGLILTARTPQRPRPASVETAP